MSEVKFGSWSVAESPINIEYSLVLIEEIRRAVSEGFQRLSRDGIEVGGVLYGVREGRTVRVLATREIVCEHARGPSFHLSQKDRAALAEQLAQDQLDARLGGMICAGWFVSHTRSEIALADSDQEIYAAFFPAPWQMTMVIRPGRGGSMRAGFFVREADGTVKSERSYMEFSFPDRLAGVLDSVPRRERLFPLDRRGFGSSRADGGGSAAVAPVPRDFSARDFPPDAQPEFAGPRFLPMSPPKRKLGWLLAWLAVVIGLLVFGERFFMSWGVAEPVGLSVVERDRQLQIEWNHTASSVTSATGGSLEIVDGADTRVVALTPQDLGRGKFTYARNTGDIDVRMTVVDGKGTKLQEASRFLGPPPGRADGSELDALRQRRDQLEAEVNRLRGQNAQQIERDRRAPAPKQAAPTAMQTAPAPARFPLQLDVEAQGKDLNIRWNSQSVPVIEAREGQLVITEPGQKPQIVNLDPAQLASGHVYYQSTAGRLEFRLEVLDGNGTTARESVLALSSRPAAPSGPQPGGREPTRQVRSIPIPVPDESTDLTQTEKIERQAPSQFTAPARRTPEPARTVLLDQAPQETGDAVARGLRAPGPVSGLPTLTVPPPPPRTEPVTNPPPPAPAVSSLPVPALTFPPFVGRLAQLPAVPKWKVSPILEPALRAQIRREVEISIRAQIDDTGRVVKAEPVSHDGTSSGYLGYLEAAAVNAMMKWRFTPARLGDKAVASEQTVTFIFRKE